MMFEVRSERRIGICLVGGMKGYVLGRGKTRAEALQWEGKGNLGW